ncbi:MAG: D-glycero-beta-D-manno-heptose 1-phosphate adenylyltransferase [Armatimonadetes bacterium]|nr:D-glycero-beta-D-manno-heptose 1-phosphate adenylyltransferase [Armatimonadota bacterium]
MRRKIYPLDELVRIVSRLKSEGERIVFTNGCFDILHVGHVRYLQAARNLGDRLVVAVNSDASVRSLKGDTRPFIPEDERTEILAALECIDYVTLFAEMRPHRVIESLQPHIHTKGGDYQAEDLPEAPVVYGYGGEIVIIPVTEGHSTSSIVRHILDRHQEG